MLKHFPSDKIIAGCDESGRGCLAGPVVSAAVILPKKFKNNILNDSKIISEKKRNILRPIIEKQSLSWAIGIVYPDEIDKINILNASFLAMHRAIENLAIKTELLIIDGNRFNPYPEIPHECIIKGDGKYQNIAAASILAKTYRDIYMKKIHFKFPEYGWDKNKGYGTKFHMDMIKEYGKTKFHRKTFKLKKLELKIGY